jgi:hypothetical protein
MHKVRLIISEIILFPVFPGRFYCRFVGKLEDATSSFNTLLGSRRFHNWDQTIAVTPVIGIVHTERMMKLFAM